MVGYVYRAKLIVWMLLLTFLFILTSCVSTKSALTPTAEKTPTALTVSVTPLKRTATFTATVPPTPTVLPESQLIALITETKGPLIDIAFSPNGQWLAYIPLHTLPTQGNKVRGLAKIYATHQEGGGATYGVVYIAPANQPLSGSEVGFCGSNINPTENDQDSCQTSLLWSPDSQSLVWSDQRGIWLAKVEHNAQLMTDVYADLFDWSPLGRYIRFRHWYSEGSTQEILDTQTGQVAPIPDTFEYTIPGPEVSWREDGRLMVVRHRPISELWYINSTEGDGLVYDKPATPHQRITIDLQLSIQNGNLMQQEQVIISARPDGSNLVEFSSSGDGKVIALYYLYESEYSLELFDVQTQLSKVVYRGNRCYGGDEYIGLLAISISPDGQWLAYIPYNCSEANSTGKRIRGLAAPAIGRGYISGSVYLVKTSTSLAADKVGECDGCEYFGGQSTAHNPLSWSPNSQELVWAGYNGIWIVKPSQVALQVLEESAEVLDWSPKGEYFRIRTQDGQYVLSVKTGERFAMPDFIDYYYILGYEDMEQDVIWQEDGSLVITRYPPTTEIWQLDPNSVDLLVLDK